MLKNVREIFLSLEASIRERLFFNSAKARCQDIPSLLAASAHWMQGLQAQTQITKFKRITWDPQQHTTWGIMGNPFVPLRLSLENWKFRQEEAPQITNKLFYPFEGNGPKPGIFTRAEFSLEVVSQFVWERAEGLALVLYIRTSISEPPTGSSHLPKTQTSWEGSNSGVLCGAYKMVYILY